MLNSLSIRNIVLIDTLDIDFNFGLTAITGETGAGKSIIIDALCLATGSRTDRNLVRVGADKSQCIANFSLSKSMEAILSNNDIDFDVNDGLTLRRTLTKDGRSKAFINDQAVGGKLLASIGNSLLEIHGQHDERGLMNSATHLTLLDTYAGHKNLLNDCKNSYLVMVEMNKKLEKLKEIKSKNINDKEYIEYSIEELNNLNPKIDEEQKLAASRRILQGSEEVLKELNAVKVVLDDDGIFESAVSSSINRIENLYNKFDNESSDEVSALKMAVKALESSMLEKQEALSEVSSALDLFVPEPQKLNDIEQRLFALRAAARKYKCHVNQLIQVRESLYTQISEIESVEVDFKNALKKSEESRLLFNKASNLLSKSRHKFAKLLDIAVQAELEPLRMNGAKFFTKVDFADFSSTGKDKVQFLVSTNPGAPEAPLNKIASGGEMSRFALAIKVALASENDAVMVFDEVDQGIGGAVANAVGERLSKLSKTNQIFVVTHSPQVAAKADSQYKIEKSTFDTLTKTSLRLISNEDREEEIARMLSGKAVTNEARAAAKKLLNS